MRDPKRIPIIVKELATCWKKHPDLRLGQLLWGMTQSDPFYLEDDRLLEILRGLNK